MSTLSPDRWKRLSPHLDDALAMTDEERSAWLWSLRAKDPVLAGELERLLGEHRLVAEEAFLEEPSLPLPGARCFPRQTIGLYTLISEIGSGGMGSVWLAERSDGRFDRRVAIKFLNFALGGLEAEHRFKREGRILARLSHPNIAELLDAGVSPAGQSYLVLEYIEGEHIDVYCDRRTLDTQSRIRLFLDVLAAISHAHSNLIVHRDIKPSNVLVRGDGQVKLLDFGIAKLLADESASAETTLLTVGGMRPMTPGYAAPEQLQGGAVTTITDVYATGILLYELLTGQHPGGNSLNAPADFVKAVIDKEPLRPSVAVDPVGAGEEVAQRAALRSSTPEKLRRTLRGDLDTIIMKALKKEPIERYSSVDALVDDLRRYLRSEPISARPDTLTYRAAKFVRRNRTSAVLATLVVVATVAGGMATLRQARTARVQRDFALRQLVRAERITGLNELLLSDVAPLGRPLTTNELLDREEHIVEREHYDDAADHVELLISIGGQYSGEEENAKARRVLEQAYQLSRNLQDPATRAKASCELAWSLVPGGELARAESLFQEGLKQLPNQPQYAPVRVLCLMRGSEIAYRNGQGNEVLERARAAERMLNESPARHPVEELNVLMTLAGAYGAAGKFREANAAFERASARMNSLGYDETQKAVRLFNDWGLTLSDAGRPLEAANAYWRAIEISRANQTEDAVLPTLLHNYSAVLRELGRLHEAADYSERAHQRAVKVGDQMLASQANLQRARIYRDEHDFARAAAILAEMEPQLRRALPPGHYAFASFASDKSQLAQAQGNLPLALQLANEAVAIDEAAIKAGGQGKIYLPTLLVRRSAVELEMGNRDQAAADAARAVELLHANLEPGTKSSNLGRAYLALGRALAAQGKNEEARLISRAAVENLEVSVGTHHPDTRSAERLLS